MLGKQNSNLYGELASSLSSESVFNPLSNSLIVKVRFPSSFRSSGWEVGSAEGELSASLERIEVSTGPGGLRSASVATGSASAFGSDPDSTSAGNCMWDGDVGTDSISGGGFGSG